MRPIDADALEARMYHDAFEVDSDMQRWDSGCWIRYKMFENAIREAPTIEERKKGKWLCSDDMYESGICSVCKWDTGEPYNNCKKWFKFCPNCGADMRGEQDGH